MPQRRAEGKWPAAILIWRRSPALALRARNAGRDGRLPRGPFSRLVTLAGCSPPRAPRCAAAPPRNWPRAAASRRFSPFPARPGRMPPGRRVFRLGPSVPSRLRGLRGHRFRAWGAGCGAWRRGCARNALRPRLRRSHPASPSIGICPLRPWPSGTAWPPLTPSPAYRGMWRNPSIFLLPEPCGT